MKWLPFALCSLGLAGLLSCTGSEAAAPETVSVQDTEHAYSASINDARTMAEAAAEAPSATVNMNTRFSYSGELTQGGFIRGVVPDGTEHADLGGQALEVAQDGTFFAAFDRDSASTIILKATTKSGQTVTEELIISPRKWDIERVNVARRKLRDPEAYWRKREPEHNAIVAARAKQTDAQGWRQEFIWPVTGRISGRFGRQRFYRGEAGGYHSGVDIARPTGTPFVAPADGVVVLARMGFSLEGGLIIVDHGNGLNSAFLHASRILVEEGQAVSQGEHIGDVGSTGRSTGPHLHWGLKWNSARFDPLLLAGPMN